MGYRFVLIFAIGLGIISCKPEKKAQQLNSVESYGNRQHILKQNQL